MQRIGIVCAGLVFAAQAWSQNRVDGVHRAEPGTMYHRVYAVVPMIGTGSPQDPKRPMLVPLPSEMKEDHSGILAFQMQFSDDRTMALVEIVGVNRSALAGILSAATPGKTGVPGIVGVGPPSVKIFEQGTFAPADLEAEFQKYKKGFSFVSV